MSSLEALRAKLSPVGNARSRGDRGTLDHVAGLARRPLDRAFLRRAGALDDLASLGGSVVASAPAPTGPRVLLLGLRGHPDHNAYEAVIAQGLRMRGAEVVMVRCGGGQPVCEMGWSRRAHPRPCDRCAWHAGEVAQRSELPWRSLGDDLPWGTDGRRAPVDDAAALTGSLDAHALSHVSLVWFQRSSNPAAEADGAEASRDFAISVAGMEQAARRLLDDVKPDIVFGMNGLFAAERVIREVALERGVRAPTYEIAPRSGALVFSQESPAPNYDNDFAWERSRDRPLTDAQRAAVQGLLDDRARGVGAHERYFEQQEERVDALREQLTIPPGDRVVSLFTNLSWDSATLDKDVGFGSMFDWVLSVVESAADAHGVTLVVRVHPAETRWLSRESTEAIVRERFGALPANVRFIGPDRALSSYALLELSDLVCTYTTTVGLEAATRGVPVAVAGETHYRARGFTHDVAGPDELRGLIHDGAPLLTDAERDLALRYAFTFFYRCSIPFPLVRVDTGHVRSVPTDASQVAPGADQSLDWVCGRILDGEPFVLPDELAGP